jgi:outer membrane protein TolC
MSRHAFRSIEPAVATAALGLRSRIRRPVPLPSDLRPAATAAPPPRLRRPAVRLFPSIALALACPWIAGSALASDETGTVDAAATIPVLIDEAMVQNPDIDAMRARSRELGELARSAGVWNDPRVSVEYANVPVDSFRLDESPMSGVVFKLQQRLPEWGSTGASKAVAERRVARSEYERTEAELQLALGIEQLYWNLTLSRLLEDVTQRHHARTLELIRAVRARYEVGRVGQNALLRLEVLEQRLEDDLGDYTRAQRTLSAGLARALAREPGAAFETPTVVAATPPEGDLQGWTRLARASNPQLAALREEVALQTDAAALSRTKLRPDVDVWVAYRLRTANSVDDGTDFFSAGVSLPIPLGSRKTALRGEAASFAARDGARARLAAELDRIEAELIEAEAGWTRATEKARHYAASLIPAARAALETTLNDFAVDKAEFSTLYEAEIDVLMLERAQLSAAVETHLQRAIVRATPGHDDLGGES